jgi:alpha-L-fucosidase
MMNANLAGELVRRVCACWPAILFVAAATAFLDTRGATAADDKETDPLVLKKLEQFQDWKFGFFVHWGVYSQWGCIESWPLVEADQWARPDDLKAWTERNKDFSRFFSDYRKLHTTFNPQKFDPRKWADAAKAAGMKYFIFTTKHHDGFSMFDTRQTDYRATGAACPFHANPRANAAKELFDTFRKEGFHIGTYFSKADWHHPGYWDPARPHKDRNVNYDTKKEPERWAGFVKFTHAQIEELMTGYGPVDILWLDAGQVRPPQQDIDMPSLAAMARRHQPGILVVDRTVGGRYENYRTPEQEVPEKPLAYVWETCMTMGDQWSYKPDDKYKSTRKLIHLLVDIVAKGGNFLLNVGPNADGELPEPALQRMHEIGRWMKVNGPAIYGTRPVAPYKSGRTCLTRKGEKLFLIYLAGKDETAPPAEIEIDGVPRGRSVRMLGVDQAIRAAFGPDGVKILVPEAVRKNPPCEHAWVFEMTLGEK